MENGPAPPASWTPFPPRPEAPCTWRDVSAIPRCLYSESRLLRYGWERHGECAFRAAERIFPVRAGADPAALRGELLRPRGVRDAVIAPQQGVVRLTVYADSFDADTAKKLIEGKGQWLR